MENSNNTTRTNSTANSSSNNNTTHNNNPTNSSTTSTSNSSTSNSSLTPSSSANASSSSIRQSHKRTFSESDSSSRTERHLCSFSHLWIINYLSSYIDDSNSTCLQSESFSPVNTPYSNTRWSLKLYPRGLNEKQHTNNNIAIFLKYVSGTMPTIKAKAEFSVVSRNNELVMLRSTNFHTFSSGNDWGYSEFLDGNYLNSRRNELITDDRLRVYVRVVLVDEKEVVAGDILRHPHVPHHHHHHHHHHPPSSILPPPPPSSQHPIPPQQQQQQTNSVPKTQASTSSSSASSSTLPSSNNPTNSSTTSTQLSNNTSGLFNDDKERFKSFELLSTQMKILLDDERFADVHIHVIREQTTNSSSIQNNTNQQQQQQQHQHHDEQQRKSSRIKHQRNSIKQQQPSCSSCHCVNEKIKINNEQSIDHHEQSSIGICKDSESDNHDCRHTSPSSSSNTPTTRRTTRSTTSLLSRIAQSSSDSSNHSSSNTCSTSSTESSSSSSSELCSSSSNLSLSTTHKRCSCNCHHQDHHHSDQDLVYNYQQQQSQLKYANITPLATFHAHKAILMSRSSSFANQIRHCSNWNTTNSKLPSIDLYIDDLDPTTVRIMLVYIYTGRLITSNDDIKNNFNAIDLFRAAVKYDLHELRQLAKSTMLDLLKIDNAIEMLEVSDQANDTVLKQQVLAFIRTNAGAVSKTNNWLQFTKRYPHLIIDAFRSLVTPPSTTNTKQHNNNNNNNNNFHSTSLTATTTTTTTTTTGKQYSKYD